MGNFPVLTRYDGVSQWPIALENVYTGGSFQRKRFVTYQNSGYSPIGGAIQNNGSIYNDYTGYANDSGANDVPLFRTSGTVAVNDAFYFGFGNSFTDIKINIGTAGAGVWTIAWEYCSGVSGDLANAWTALSGVSDGTTGFKTAGTNNVTFTNPGGLWLPATITAMPVSWTSVYSGAISHSYQKIYWVRGRVSAYTSLTVRPVGTQMWVNGWTPIIMRQEGGGLTPYYTETFESSDWRRVNDVEGTVAITEDVEAW